MAADANVFARFLGPAKSMADFQAEDLALQDAALTAQSKRMALEDAQSKRAKSNALDAILTQAYSQPGGNPLETLLKSGNPDAVMMGQKMQSEQMKTQGEAALKRAQAFTAQLGAMKQYAGAIAANPSPEYAMSALDEYARATGMDVSADRQALSRMQPEQIRQWALGKAGQVEAILPQWEWVNAGDRMVPRNKRAATQEPIPVGVSPSVAAQIGQQKDNNLSRERIASMRGGPGGQEKAPAGYRYTASGDLEAIPGGPADAKLQQKRDAEAKSADGTIAALDALAAQANELMQHPGLDRITGLSGMLPNVPGFAGADAEALLTTLKSKTAFGVLQAMRDASKTGGALGAVSEKELKLLESNLGALEKAQSLEQFQKELRKIVKYAQDSKDRIKAAQQIAPAATSAPGAGSDSGRKVVDFGSLK